MTTPLPASETVTLDVQDGIALVTLNRPQARNAMTLEMYARLAEIFSAAANGSVCKAIVITGAGGRAFASGTEISTFRSMNTPEQAHAYESRIDDVLQLVERCPVPTIAALSGACTGGGAAIAACCDIRIATQDLQYGFPIARTLGNCLSVASLSRLVALAGAGRVREMLLTARLLSAKEALQAGIVSEVLDDHDAVLEHAMALAHAMARNAPLTIRATKEAILRLRTEGATADDRDLIALCYMSEDFREGVEAFITRRPPVWKGR
jgi:enoyl-CoA hydratase/carnithine racemase